MNIILGETIKRTLFVAFGTTLVTSFAMKLIDTAFDKMFPKIEEKKEDK